MRDWIEEAKSYRKQVYDIGDGKLGYDYNFKNKVLFESQLKKAGLRFADALNQAL
jgi:hypothetical protein